MKSESTRSTKASLDRAAPLSPEEFSQLKRGENPCRVLRQLRGHGMSQQKLADLIGKSSASKSYICHLELGHYVGSLGVWRDICRVFKVSLDEIAPFVRDDNRSADRQGRPPRRPARRSAA